MVDNPNSVLAQAVAGKTILSTIVLRISTADLTPTPNQPPQPPPPPPPPTSGGGTSNIGFLQGVGNAPNAQAGQMDAVFWIETVQDGEGLELFLQYSQRVLLNFNGLSWPHVSVATLVKQQAIA